MQKIFFLIVTLFIISSSLCGENFSEMSTQELISIMGYVKAEDQKKFREELQSRVANMSKAERKMYNKNKKQLEK